MNFTDGVELDDASIVFWALHGYGVTVSYLAANLVVVLIGMSIMTLNALVLNTMVGLRRDLEPVNIIVSSLAIADFLTGLLLLYQCSYNLVNYQIYLECLFRFGVLNGLVVSSALHIVFLTMERYLKIIAPFRHRLLCETRFVVGQSVALWMFSAVCAFLPLMGWSRHVQVEDVSCTGSIQPEEDGLICIFFIVMHPNYLRFVLVLFWIAVLTIGLLYLHIFQVANKHARQIRAQHVTWNQASCPSRYSWKCTKTVLVIMSFYIFCKLPVVIVYSMSVLDQLDMAPCLGQGTILLYASFSVYVNSAMNPVVFAIRIPAVRRRFRVLFCCCRDGNETVQSQPSCISNRCGSGAQSRPLTQADGGVDSLVVSVT